MTELTLDTNILFYAFDPADGDKHALAKRILASCYLRVAPMSLQCLSEFYRSATRKRLVPPSQASVIVADLRKGILVIPPSEADLEPAMQIHRQYGFQFFDCLLLATMSRVGCTTLLSEDFQHRRTVLGINILDPFKLSVPHAPWPGAEASAKDSGTTTSGHSRHGVHANVEALENDAPASRRRAPGSLCSSLPRCQSRNWLERPISARPSRRAEV